MSDVFISYSRDDTRFVDKLIRDLEAKGFDVWLDRADIEGGSTWRAEISEAIRGCRAFVIILSPNSTRSRNVSRELSLAESHDRVIIPIIYKDCDIPPAMEYQLAELQWINLTKLTYAESLERLARVLNKFPGTNDGEAAPAPVLEKRRKDTARLRKMLEKRSTQFEAESGTAGQTEMAEEIEADEPDRPAKSEPPAYSPASIIPANLLQSKKALIILACVVGLGIGGYALYSYSSGSGPSGKPSASPNSASKREQPNPTPTLDSTKPTAEATPAKKGSKKSSNYLNDAYKKVTRSLKN